MAGRNTGGTYLGGGGGGGDGGGLCFHKQNDMLVGLCETLAMEDQMCFTMNERWPIHWTFQCITVIMACPYRRTERGREREREKDRDRDRLKDRGCSQQQADMNVL